MKMPKNRKSKLAIVWTDEMTKLRDESLKMVQLLESDPEFNKLVEKEAMELKRKLGSLSSEALKQRFTI